MDKENILKIVHLGHPALREVSSPILPSDLGNPSLRRLKKEMIETMFHASGVGLAGPQVAKLLRCFVYFVPDQDKEDEWSVPPTFLVNPTIQPMSEEEEFGWEGCLSIPKLRGLVPRYEHIFVEALDVEGKPHSFEAHGFHARVLQHEYDHLDGVIFLDRMEDMESLCFEAEWEKYVLPLEEGESPVEKS